MSAKRQPAESISSACRIDDVENPVNGFIGTPDGDSADAKQNDLLSELTSKAFSDIFLSFPVSAILLDGSGTIISVNDSWKTFTEENQLSPERNRIGTNYVEYCDHAAKSGYQIGGEIRDGVAAILRGESMYFSVDFPYPQLKEPRWLRTIAHPLKNQSKFLVVQIDITNQKLAEFALKKQVEILNLVHDAILVVDMQDRITFANRAASDLYGWSRSELIGKTGRDFRVADSHYDFERKKKTLLAGNLWSGEFIEVNSRGQKLTMGARWTLIRDDSGAEAILKVHSDLSLLGQFLRAQRMQTVGSIAGGVAHDLNNLLTPIVLLSEQIQDDTASRHKVAGQRISLLASRASELIRQLLGFAKGFEGDRREEPVSDIVQSASEMLRLTLPRQIKLNVESAADGIALVCNRVQIHQVIMNLCLNARDAISGNGSLSMSVRPIDVVYGEQAFLGEAAPGRYVEISVADTGAGMTSQDLDRIFEPFYSTKPPGQGTGLGLSTCLGIIKSHGGFMRVTSQPGRGSLFSVYLPLENETQIAVKPRNLNGMGAKILIVDPDTAESRKLKLLLEANGFKAETAATADEAVTQVLDSETPFAFVFSEISLQPITARDLLLYLNQVQSGIRMIGMSKTPQPACAPNSYEGLSGFVQKPLRSETVLNLLDELLVRGGAL